MYQFSQEPTDNAWGTIRRIRVWYFALAVIFMVFGIRLFYLQIIQHEYYTKAALKGQLKEYQMPAERGIIQAHDGNQTVPLVLNEKRYTLFADPKFIKDPSAAATAVQKIIGGDAGKYENMMRMNSRYAVLAKKLPKDKLQYLVSC